jgi:DNA-directed RNA polymerase specialized sigma24 family protein
MYNQNEEGIKSLIARHQQRIYALALYLIGQDEDMAYDICASSFAEAIQESFSAKQGTDFMLRLIGVTVERCRGVRTVPTFDIGEFLEAGETEKAQLLMLLKVLQTLDFELKASLLLRFQLNLSYNDIGMVMRTSANEARTRTARARAQLDREIEHMLGNA